VVAAAAGSSEPAARGGGEPVGSTPVVRGNDFRVLGRRELNV
jgi:hypothetical protein